MLATQMDECVETAMDDDGTAAEFRSEKVRTARCRLAHGRYDREEVVDRILDALLADMTR